MKRMLGIALAWMIASATWGQGFPTAKINGVTYTNITDVHVGAGGKIVIVFSTGGIMANADSLSDAFLDSWNINKEARDDAKTSAAKKAVDDLERAIQIGSFRELDGVVYDTRKSQAGWTSFSGARVVQVLDDGALLDLTPNAYVQHTAIMVKHMPSTVADTDVINFTAKLVGNYSYINKLEDDRTIRAYDFGFACTRSEIPESVLSGKTAYAATEHPRIRAKEKERPEGVLDSLPDSEDLKASGSAFFITEDGYLLTNWHVVEKARKIKIKNSAGIFTAAVIRLDEPHDLALLKVSGKFTPLPISTDDAQLGEAVFTIGFPNIDLQGTEPKYTDGKISSLTGMKDNPRDYQISVPVQPGNSGGPLVNMAGSVNGIIVARLSDLATLRTSGTLPQSVNYAVKSRFIRGFLSQIPEVKLPRAKLTGNNPTAVKSAEQSIAMVLVY